MTKQKQVVFTSPLLVRKGQYLYRKRDGKYAVCIDRLLEYVDVPASKSYEIEISSTQWSDGKGCELWLRDEGIIDCGPTRHDLNDTLMRIAEVFVKRHLKPPRDEPTRYYFRLLYD